MDDPVADETYRALAATISRATQTLPDEPAPEPTAVVEVAPPPVAVPYTPSEPTDEPRSRPSVADAFAYVGKDEIRGSHHHTMVPRTMVIAALLAALGSPLFLWTLHREGHLEVDGTDWTIDERGRYLVHAAIVAVVACYVLGWFWWTIAASLNARRQSRYTVSPWFAPTTLVIAGVVVWQLTEMLDGAGFDTAKDHRQAIATGIIGVAVLLAHFGVLGSFRRSAGSVGGNQGAWSSVIAVPWAAVAVGVVGAFFAETGEKSVVSAVVVIEALLASWYILSLYRAMATFDRACVGRLMAHDGNEPLPEFLKRSR